MLSNGIVILLVCIQDYRKVIFNSYPCKLATLESLCHFQKVWSRCTLITAQRNAKSVTYWEIHIYTHRVELFLLLSFETVPPKRDPLPSAGDAEVFLPCL